MTAESSRKKPSCHLLQAISESARDVQAGLGKGPQNLAITPDGSLLLCANMPGNNLAVFRIAPASGRLTPVGEPVAITAPACITIVP